MASRARCMEQCPSSPTAASAGCWSVYPFFFFAIQLPLTVVGVLSVRRSKAVIRTSGCRRVSRSAVSRLRWASSVCGPGRSTNAWIPLVRTDAVHTAVHRSLLLTLMCRTVLVMESRLNLVWLSRWVWTYGRPCFSLCVVVFAVGSETFSSRRSVVCFWDVVVEDQNLRYPT